MDQHPIPRQITTFEFKLIGFLTLKQFLYLVVFTPIAFIVFKLFPIPLLNLLLAIVILLFGLAFAFVPINDRPFDIWIRNLIKRLFSPVQFVYHKEPEPLYFLQDLYFVANPRIVAAHVESKEKLAMYLAKTKSSTAINTKKQNISNLLSLPKDMKTLSQTQTISNTKAVPATNATMQNQTMVDSQIKQPFFIGVVKNSKALPLPGILIYIKDQKGNTLRLLRTNLKGNFATFNPIPPHEYTFEIKDPKGQYFFDTMKVKIENNSVKPIEFQSKELL